MNPADRARWWTQLLDAGLVTGAPPDAVPDGGAWYIRAMVGAAAWIAAVFLLVFVGLGLHELVRTSGAAVVTGLVVCGFAAVLLHFAAGMFATQFGLALSLTGQALFALGVLGLIRGGGLPGTTQMLAIAAFEAFLVVVVPGFVHRAFCTLAAAFALCYALGAAGLGALGLPIVAAFLVTVELSDIALARMPRAAPAIGVGLALAIVAVLPGQLGADDIGLWRPTHAPSVLRPWLEGIAMGVVLFAAAVRLLAQAGIDRRTSTGIGAMIGAAALAFASAFVPGLAAGLLIVLVAFGTAQRPLAGLGLITLLAAVSRYYYTLAATLLVKSASLFVAAAVLLALAYLLRRTADAGEERRA